MPSQASRSTPSTPKRKRRAFSVEFKTKVLRLHLYEHQKINALAEQFDLPQNTISTWKKQADKLFKEAGSSTPKRKRIRLSPYKDIELALLYWLKDMRSRDVPPPLSFATLRVRAER